MATTPNTTKNPSPMEPKTNNSLRLVIVILIIVLIGGGLTYFLLNSNQDTSGVTDQSTIAPIATDNLATATPEVTATPTPSPTPTAKDTSNAAINSALNSITDDNDSDLSTVQKDINKL